MYDLRRNNVRVLGRGPRTMILAHGYGCDQNMWRHIVPAFEDDFRIVLFDYVGHGGSDPSAFDRTRYSSLAGYADDVLQICEALAIRDAVFVGHSVSAMIGVIAALKDPSRFESLVMIGPSPCYVNDGEYMGGFTREDIEGLLDFLDSNHLGWSSAMAPVIMKNPDRPELSAELENSFCRTDPQIARHFARVTFLSDNRADLANVRIPCLILQCAEDNIAPERVGQYVREQVPGSTFVQLSATGHCPHLSDPAGTIAAMKPFLAQARADSAGPEMTDDSFMAGESAEELFEQAPCGYLAAQPNGAIVRVNETFLRMTGLAREAVLAGMKFQQFLTVPGQIYYDTHVAPLLQMQGFVREIAFDLKTNSGSGVIPVVFNCVQKNSPAGRALLLRITLFDASDRRKYERELLIARRIADEATQTERLAREEAERANRTKDDFLALVSHELRTPLSAILGWVQVLRRKLTDADLERGLSVIERNTRLQTRLVDDLLDLSRMASGKMRLDVQRVNLANVIEAAFETTTPSANARQVRLQKILDPAIVVSGDPGRLQQVFWNLLSNAVKFTPKDGFARVVMERVNSHIEVSVVDSGQGMSADFLEHAFERFRQSGPARTGETGGLGLGLALVKYLVEMHGGSIVARSEGEGRGSTFLVKLPLAVVEQSEGADRIHPRSAVAHAERRERAVSLAGIEGPPGRRRTRRARGALAQPVPPRRRGHRGRLCPRSPGKYRAFVTRRPDQRYWNA